MYKELGLRAPEKSQTARRRRSPQPRLRDWFASSRKDPFGHLSPSSNRDVEGSNSIAAKRIRPAFHRSAVEKSQPQFHEPGASSLWERREDGLVAQLRIAD